MHWVVLVCAGIMECAWTVGMKYSQGFSRLIPSLLTIAAMIASMWLLSVAIKQLPLGTAYAIWTGIGTLGTFIMGIILFHDPVSMARTISALFILAGIVGLKVFGSA